MKGSLTATLFLYFSHGEITGIGTVHKYPLWDTRSHLQIFYVDCF